MNHLQAILSWMDRDFPNAGGLPEKNISVLFLQQTHRCEKKKEIFQMSVWTEKVILITGGSSGIGKAAAKKFLEKKAIVYIVGRDTEKLETVRKELCEISSTIHPIASNVAIPSECRQAVEYVVSREKRLDVLVNSAGISYQGPCVSMTETMWDETLDINLKGTFFMCQSAVPALAQTRGAIVNISSDAGLIGNKKLSIYCASKGGVTLLTKALALELAAQKIRVNAVCPGEVETPMLITDFKQSGHATQQEFDAHTLGHYPQGQHARYTQPEEVAECIYFLASTDKVEAITGACLSIDFGITSGY